ncbi:MAG: hypothetical protein U9Q99_02635 [Nanoarchaeota archaeon]|nr:hypothetical protein [Nanoarchaeota archaeon]
MIQSLSIEKKLTPIQLKELYRELLDNAYSRFFFKLNNLDYTNPDMDKVRQITFKQYYARITEA